MRWNARWMRVWRNEAGASMVEFSIAGVFMFLLIGGLLDFGLLFYQLNSATKALYQGARLASVSCPLSSALKSKSAVTGSRVPGDPVPYFKITCTGGSPGACTEGTFNSNAMTVIFAGRDGLCGSVNSAAGDIAGMCDVFPTLQQHNVRVTYEHTGLGFVGRPGGPVATITLELVDMNYGFIFLRGLTALSSFAFPAMKTTATSEDMNHNGTNPTTASISECVF